MKLHIYLVGLIFLGVIMMTFGRPEEDEEEEEERPRSCQKYIYDFVMSILTSTLRCLGGQSTFKLNNIFELATRPGCLLKCVLQQDGVISIEDGRLDDIAAAFYFEETFSPEVREITLPEAQACFALAEDFRPKEYWCKSYLPFVECSFKAILKGLIPYGGDCITNPLIGILFSVFKYLSPDSPSLSDSMDELRRSVYNTTKYTCLDKNCTRLYEYKKVNGTNSIVIYNKDMEVISVEAKKPKLQQQQQQQQKAEVQNSNSIFGNQYQNKYTPKYNYNGPKYNYNSPFSSGHSGY